MVKAKSTAGQIAATLKISPATVYNIKKAAGLVAKPGKAPAKKTRKK